MRPNIKLLKKVRKYILKHPERYNQNIWRGRNPCGTTACIAGATIICAYPRLIGATLLNYLADTDASRIPRIAAQKLGLNQWESTRLFNVVSDWPQPFKAQYIDARTAFCRSSAAANYIDSIIEKKLKNIILD